MQNFRPLVVAALSTFALASSAHAQEPPQPDAIHAVSVTFSPIHLILPFLELQAEFPITPTIGVSGIAGLGSITVSSSDESVGFLMWELGAQLEYYLVGDFDHGLQLGMELLYLHISAAASGELSGVFGNGFSVSPFIGYKVVADFGLTFQAQLGPAIIFASANSDSESASAVEIGPMLNLNLGWSF